VCDDKKVEVIEFVAEGRFGVEIIEEGEESERWPNEEFLGEKEKFDFSVEGEYSSDNHLRLSIGDRAERERVRVRVLSLREEGTVGVLERELVKEARSEARK
jgi:L-fucose isomerase-like protein